MGSERFDTTDMYIQDCVYYIYHVHCVIIDNNY